MKATNNVIKIFGLNLRFTFKSKSILVISTMLFLCSIIFSSIYANSNDYLQFTKLLIFAFETILSMLILGVLILLISHKLFFSAESKNLQDIEQRYGIKLWKMFIYRFVILVLYVYSLIFIYFFIQIIAFSFLSNFESNLLHWILPKLNNLLYSLMFAPLSVLLTMLFSKSNFASIFMTLIMVIFIGSPTILGIIDTSSSTSENQITVNKINKTTLIGSSFYESAHKDKSLNMEEWNFDLFGRGGYFGNFTNARKFSNLSRLNDINDDIKTSISTAFFAGQSLNLIDENKHVMEFNKEYYNMFLELQNSLKQSKSNLLLSDVPFYEVWQRSIKFLDLNYVMDNLRNSNFNKNYPNLFEWIDSHWNLIINNIRNSGLGLYAEYWVNDGTDIETFFPSINDEQNQFYKSHPEFLAISQIINAGFMSSFQPTIFEYIISSDEFAAPKHMNIDFYNELISNARTSSYLNILNFVTYQSFQYVDIDSFQMSKRGLFKYENLAKINFGDFSDKIYNSPENSYILLPTDHSIYSDINLQINRSPLLIYIYTMQILTIAVFMSLSTYVYIIKRRI